MLWRVSGRWSTYRPPFRVTENIFNPFLRQFSRARAVKTHTAAISQHAHTSMVDLRPETHTAKGGDHTRHHPPVYIANPPGESELMEVANRMLDADPSQRHALWNTATWTALLADSVTFCRIAECLSRSYNPHQMLLLLEAARAAGIKHRQNVYEQFAFYLARAKNWDLVLSIVDRGICETGCTTARLLNWRGRALFETQQIAQLDSLLGDFEKYGLKPQRRTFHVLLKGHLLNHDLSRAKRVMADMEDAGVHIDDSTYTVIISAYRCLGSDKSMEGKAFSLLLDSNLDRRTTVMNALFRYHLDSHDLSSALRVLEFVAERLRGGRRLDEPEEHILEEIDTPSYLLVADCVTHSLLIDYISKHKRRRSGQVLRLLKKVPLPLDCKVAAALIRMYYKIDSEKKALSVFLEACHSPSLRDEARKSFGYKGELRSLFSFTGQPSTDLFNSLLSGSLAIHGLRIVPAILKMMSIARTTPNSTTLEILISYLKLQRRISLNDFLLSIQYLFAAGFLPTEKQLNQTLSAILAFEKRLRYKEGWHALSYQLRSVQNNAFSAESIQRNSPPLSGADLGVAIYNPNTSIRSILGSIVQLLESRGIKPDRATFAIRMRFDLYTLPPVQALEAIKGSMQRMRELGLHPTLHHHAVLIEAYCNAKNYDAAHLSIESAVADGILREPSSHVRLYTIMITSYARDGKPSLALEVVQRMLRGNVSLDAAAIHAVVGAFFAVKGFRIARSLLLELWPLIAPFPEELREATLQVLVNRFQEERHRSKMTSGMLSRTGKKRIDLRPTRSQVLQAIERITAMLGSKETKYNASHSRSFPNSKEGVDGGKDLSKELIEGSR